MEILENEDGRFHLVNDLVQRDERILGRRVAVFLGLDGGAGRHQSGAERPLEHLLLPLVGNVLDQLLDPRFLVRKNVEDRVTRPDQGFDFFSKVHGALSMADSAVPGVDVSTFT